METVNRFCAGPAVLLRGVEQMHQTELLYVHFNCWTVNNVHAVSIWAARGKTSAEGFFVAYLQLLVMRCSSYLSVETEDLLNVFKV